MNLITNLFKVFNSNGKKSSFAVGSHFDMAMKLTEWGDLNSAEDLLVQCIDHRPDIPELHFYLGETQRKKGKIEQAIASLRQYLILDPEDRLGAGIKLTLVDAPAENDALTLKYVESLFDQYSSNFEVCLLDNLSYQTPQLIAQSILSLPKKYFKNVLDLGCGTGLSAAPFVNTCTWIEGVDISKGMIEQAQKKNIFDKLYHSSIQDFLNANQNTYDLVIAADVLVYIGSTEQLFFDIYKILADEGVFAFSIQTIDSHAFALGEDHRYSHSKSYIEECVRKSGLKILKKEHANLRKEYGAEVKGIVYLCDKA